MVSTHRRNTDLMVQCAEQVGTTLERVKASLTNTRFWPTITWSGLVCGQGVHACVSERERLMYVHVFISELDRFRGSEEETKGRDFTSAKGGYIRSKCVFVCVWGGGGLSVVCMYVPPACCLPLWW